MLSSPMLVRMAYERAPLALAWFQGLVSAVPFCRVNIATIECLFAECYLMNESVPIVRRRVDIDFSQAPAENWHPKELFWEQFLNTISFLFPPGEKFFIHSVQLYQARIRDPKLRDDVQRFIYQEAMHTREHVVCNRLLDASFSHGKYVERTGDILLRIARFLPNSSQLAISCAIEHYTATLSDHLLRRQEGFIQKADPAFAQLWLWHAVEETEHKAVCFDVYQEQVGRGLKAYAIRVLAMLLTTTLFALTVLLGLILIKFSYRHKRKVTAETQSSTSGKRKAGVRFKDVRDALSWSSFASYFRYSFHPWDHDNAHLVAEWKARFPNFGKTDEVR